MQLFLIVFAFICLAVKANPQVSAMVLIGTLVATYVAQTTVKWLTGVASPAMEVFRAVGLGVVFVLLLATWQASFNWHFSGSAMINIGTGFLLAYAAGFMVAMRIDLLQACVVAAVTTAASVGLFFLLRPLV